MTGLLRYILLATLFFPVTGYAQAVRIEGSVRAEDGVPLPGAHVFIDESPHGTVTREDGSFVLNVNEVVEAPIVLVCSIVGFERNEQSINITPGVALQIDFVMAEKMVNSSEVIVTASRRAQISSAVPASISVVGADEIRQKNIMNVDDALRYVGGVDVQDNQINIRGSSGFVYNTGSKVLLMIDGSPLLTPDSDGVPLSLIPSNRIEKIEVLKGAGSALYGSGAIGGIINVITKPPGERELMVEIDAGAYGTYRHEEWKENWSKASQPRFFNQTSVASGGKISNTLSAWVSATYFVDPGFRNFDKEQSFRLLSKITSARQRRSLSLLTIVANRRRDNFLFWAGLSDPLNPGTISISQTESPSGSSDNASNQLSLFPAARFFLSGGGVASFTGRFFASAIRPVDENGNRKPLSQGTLGIRAGLTGTYGRRIRQIAHMTTGASLDLNNTSSSFFVTSNGDDIGRQPEGALFTQVEIDHRFWAITAGLRLDSYGIDASETIVRLSPKLAVGYTPTESINLRLSAGSGFRVPSLAERFTDDQSFFPIYRNLELRPETSISIEGGARTYASAATLSFESDLAIYWSRFDNLIEPRFVRNIGGEASGIFGFQFVNLSQGRVMGIDASAVASHARGSLRLSYALVESRNADTGDDLPYRPRHNLKIATTLSIPGNAYLGVDLRYLSRPRTVDSDFARFVPDASALVDSRVVDFRAGTAFGSISLHAVVRNLLDYYYLERPALIAPPRTFSLRVALEL